MNKPAYKPVQFQEWEKRVLDIPPDWSVYKALAPKNVIEGNPVSIVKFRDGVSVGFSAVFREGYQGIYPTILYYVGEKKVAGFVLQEGGVDLLLTLNFAYGFLTAIEKYGSDDDPQSIVQELIQQTKNFLDSKYTFLGEC